MKTAARPPWRWGATAGDLATLPAPQEVLPHAVAEAVRAVPVAAPAATVFRWLCQLRVAPYSYDLVDNAGRRSPRTLIRGLEDLQEGQRFMTIFRLVDFDPDRWIRLRLHSSRARLMYGELVVTYLVRATASGSRLVAHLVWEQPPGPLPRLRSVTLAWGDLVMMRKQLLTLRDLAQGDSRAGT